MIKKITLSLLIIFLSGCNYTEISDLTIISNLGIDKVDNKYEISIITNSNELNKSKVLTKTVANIIYLLSNTDTDKNLYLGHLKNIIISNKIDKNELKQIIYLINKENSNYNIYFTNNDVKKIIKYLNENNLNKLDKIHEQNNLIYNHKIHNNLTIKSNINLKDNNIIYENINIDDNLTIKPYIHYLLIKNIKRFDFNYNNNTIITIDNIKFINNEITATYKIHTLNSKISKNNIISYLNKELSKSYNKSKLYKNKIIFKKLKEKKNE